MSFRDLNIKTAYDTGIENPLEDFYIPVLKEAVTYDRISGFYSSSSLAVAARGIAGLILNNGKMRILACPKLSENDRNIILDASQNPDEYLSEILLGDLNNISDEFQLDHIKALGWMIANNLLEIKVAIILDKVNEENISDAIFHQKVGILSDKDGNSLSFSRSLNETALGWLENVEEFKVFKQWESGQSSYYITDKMKFENYWNNKRKGVKIIDVPLAVINKFVEIGHDFHKDEFCLKKYQNAHSKKEKIVDISLYWYQRAALEKWRENNYSLLFEMATGTGKTRTALACLSVLINANPKLICVISCPQTTLSQQWADEVENLHLSEYFDEKIFADSTNQWRRKLNTALNMISVGCVHRIIIYTTHITASSKDFIQYIQSINEIPLCFIGDEAHGLGASESKKALLPNYTYRIGLSATPKRWFDDYGTEILEDFFGNESFQFTIHDALNERNPQTGKTFLVPYYYYPIQISLTDDELERYQELSEKVSKLSMFTRKSDEYQKRYEALLFERAKIIKSASNKLSELPNIIREIKANPSGTIEDCLIFVDDTYMLNNVLLILKDAGVISHKITKDEGSTPDPKYGGLTERQYIISKFKEKKFKAIVAIKCMDEGIDIPSASTAIIMSSSSNPREYVQRIGRVIRQSEGKERAYIYDFIVIPDWKKIQDPKLRELEMRIFEKEKVRIRAISSEAINNSSVLITINKFFGD